MATVIQTRGLLSLPAKPIGMRSLLQPSHGLKHRLFASKPRNPPALSLSSKKFQSFEPTLRGISISHKLRSTEFICKAEGAASSGDGDTAAIAASPKIFGVEVTTLKKIIPLGLMFFCILFNYTILRDTKDVLVVTAKGSSAEIIPFLKTWVNLPMAIGFMLLYTKLSNVLSKKALFYTVIIPFILYFGAFGFVMYPLSNYIHPEALADKLLATLGPRFMGPLAILRIWSFCLFYVMAELWGSVVISVLFWGFANQITTVDEAKKFYPLFGLGANVALIFSGRTVKYFSNLRKNLGPGVDGWAVSLKAMMSIVVGMGLAICFLYWWVNTYVPLPARSQKKKNKPKMGTMESLKFLVSSPYIRDLATLVVAYGISINLVEVTWKSKLKAQFPSPNEYSAFMGDFSTCTGIATFTMMLLSQYVFDKYGWGVAAKITPTVLLLTGVAFFSLILFGGPFAPLVAKLGMTPLLAAVYVGALQNIFSKSAKYSLFDPCKEMAYIPLDEDTKVKGKAAIDVVCNPLGKSGGALIQQFMILSFGSLANSTPYLGMILLVIVTAWLAAAKSLEGQFNALRPVFMDKRIGEHDNELGEFDKGVIRSQRARQLKAKKSMYNLSDGEEHVYGDGALGESSSARDDFDSVHLSDEDLQDDGDREDAGSNRVRHRHKDSPEEEERRKSKKEVMDEIIMKSKLGKMEKAKHKEEKEKLLDDLNKELMSLENSDAMKSLTQDFTVKDEPHDKYAMYMDDLASDRRGRPTDRTKTPEEIAQEEREKLVELEDKRKKRMQETDDLSDEDEETGGEESSKRLRVISGDDLGDSFSADAEQPKKGWIDEVLEREGDDEDSESEGEEEDDDEEEEESDGGDEKQRKGHPLKDWEQSDDELEAELEGDDDEEEEEAEPIVHKKSKKDSSAPTKGKGSSGTVKQSTNMKKLSSTQHDIPYVIHAPRSFEELIALVEDGSNADVVTIVNRIRTTDSIKLAAENRKKMQVFYGILLQYFAVLANKKPLNIELLNMLVKPLIEMSGEIPYFAAICARQRLLKTRAQFCEAIKNPEDGCWPSLKTLFLLRLWSMIFPCSDYRHAVMTPSILLMCEYLMRCPISSGRDIAIGSFLCSIVLLVAKQSKKFCPEAILFIRTLLMAASDKNLPPSEESEFYHFMELKTLTPFLCIQDDVKEVVPLNFLQIMDQPADSPYFSSDEFRASILSSVVETLRGFVEINGGLSSFPEIFMPISALLHQVGNQEKIPQTLREKLVDAAQLIEKKTEEHHKQRKPLAMRKQKPVAIRMVNPKFEENFAKGRDYDPDKYRSDMKKLKKKLNEERKGVVRELRKDSYFMSDVKAKEKAVQEQERAEKHGKNLAFLQEQEHAFKSGQLGKGKGNKKRKR